MAYDWRAALRRKLPHDLASGFPALPLLCRLFFLQLLDECDDEGRIRVGVAAPADALAAMMGAHAGERRLLRQYVPALLEGGFLRHEGVHVCLRPLAARTSSEPNEPATSRTNRERTERTANELDEPATSERVSVRNHSDEDAKPAESPLPVVTVESVAEIPGDFVDGAPSAALPVGSAPPAEGSGGSPAASLSSPPHTPSLTLPPATPSDRVVLEERATPPDLGASVAAIVGAAVTAGVAAGLAAAGRPTDPSDEPPAEKPTREPKPDVPRPLAGTPAAEALAALEATQILFGITPRPAALAFALTNGAHPAIDVPREIAAADAWLVANPANAKKRGDRFVANWCAKAQERARRIGDPQASEVRLAAPQVDAATAERDAKVAEWQRKYDALQAAKGAA